MGIQHVIVLLIYYHFPITQHFIESVQNDCDENQMKKSHFYFARFFFECIRCFSTTKMDMNAIDTMYYGLNDNDSTQKLNLIVNTEINQVDFPFSCTTNKALLLGKCKHIINLKSNINNQYCLDLSLLGNGENGYLFWAKNVSLMITDVS